MKAWLLVLLLWMGGATRAAEPVADLFMGGADLSVVESLLRRADIGGAQVVYTWRQLERSPGQYDFSRIDRDLVLVQRLGKRLFVQVQDRFFSPDARHVPDYLLDDPRYGGGLVAQVDRPGQGKPTTQGWVAMQWNPAVRERFQLLLSALAGRFDGRIAGMNLPETAIDIDQLAAGFGCDAYFEAELANIRHARRVFVRSMVVQYVNFWPCEWNDDRGYMSRLFEAAVHDGFGLGGPDIVPWRKGQMKNAYPFFHRYRGRLATVAMAVQEPTLTYRDPATGRPWSRQAIEAFGRDYLGARIIFWTPQAPWLRTR